MCSGKLKDTTYLERYVALFNGVSRWVQGMVLNFVTPQERADCIIKFQETAKVSLWMLLDLTCVTVLYLRYAIVKVQFVSVCIRGKYAIVVFERS